MICIYDECLVCASTHSIPEKHFHITICVCFFIMGLEVRLQFPFWLLLCPWVFKNPICQIVNHWESEPNDVHCTREVSSTKNPNPVKKFPENFLSGFFTAYISSFVNLWILIALLYSVILLWVCWDLAPHFIIPWSSFSEWNSRLNCTVIICTFALPQSWVKLLFISNALITIMLYVVVSLINFLQYFKQIQVKLHEAFMIYAICWCPPLSLQLSSSCVTFFHFWTSKCIKSLL